MALSTGQSFFLSILCVVLVFSGMQMYHHWLNSSSMRTILGGYLGSLLFVFSLTAFGNLETFVFGKAFQIKLIPEVLFCIIISTLSSAMIHRVCATSCLLFSIIQLYYMNKYSQKVYNSPAPVQQVQVGKKKKS